MYVQCERCKTEYDFDDALVSGRGTTVKCTNCAYQFRVKRADGASDEADRWVVTTTGGQSLTFTSLKELQRAILAKLVGRGDELARGGAPLRKLGAIAELEPFFETAESGKADAKPSPAAAEARSNPPRKRVSSRPPPIPGVVPSMLAPPPRRARSEPPNLGPMRPRIDTMRPEGDLAAAPPANLNGAQASDISPLAQTRRGENEGKETLAENPATELPPTQPKPVSPTGTMLLGAPISELVDSDATAVDSANLLDSEQETARINAQGEVVRPKPPPEQPKLDKTLAMEGEATPHRKSAPPPLPQPHRKSVPPPLPAAEKASAPPAAKASSLAPKPPRTLSRPPLNEIEKTSPLPPATRPVRRAAAYEEDLDALPMNTPRGRLGGWVVAAILLGLVGVFGAYMGRSYLAKSVHASASAEPLDPRAQQFLSAGEAALSQGDLDAAKESFDKASALADKDPRVLLPLARLATIRADVPWLRQRLISPAGAQVTAAQQADLNANKTQLDELAAKAKKAADDALAAAPDDPIALRVKVDALRIAGDRDAARALVGKVATNASQPDTAYVLGALDLAELDPPWSVVLERLRTAAAGEGGLGRARAALAYALARSGDAPAARQEADRLAGLAHPPPLVRELRAFIDTVPAAGGMDGGLAISTPTSVDVSKLPPAQPGESGGAAAGGGGGGFPSDPRVMLAQADAAKQRRDYTRARALYEAALAKNQNDSEALAGLGDVAHDEKDLQSALSFYNKAIGANPTYLPALLGNADVTWDMGDRAAAQRNYKEIADRFPEGSYPPRVKQRANDASGGNESVTPTTSATTSATSGSTASDLSNGAPP